METVDSPQSMLGTACRYMQKLPDGTSQLKVRLHLERMRAPARKAFEEHFWPMRPETFDELCLLLQIAPSQRDTFKDVHSLQYYIDHGVWIPLLSPTRPPRPRHPPPKPPTKTEAECKALRIAKELDEENKYTKGMIARQLAAKSKRA